MKRSILLLPFMMTAFTLTACDGDSGSDETTVTPQTESSSVAEVTSPPAPVVTDTSWFNSGGSLSRFKNMDDWRAADNFERLASASDLIKMEVRSLPAPKQVMEMARTLEAGITKAAEAGEQGSINTVAERIIAEQGW